MGKLRLVDRPTTCAAIFIALSRTLSRGIPLKDEHHVHLKYIKEINGIEVAHSKNRDKSMRFVEIEPLFFRTAHGNRISFRPSRDKQQMYLFDFNLTGDGQFTRISLTSPPASLAP